MSFFNGADLKEVVTLASGTKESVSPTPIVNQMFTMPAFVQAVMGVLDSQLEPLDLQIALVDVARKTDARLGEYSSNSIYTSVSSRVNKLAKQVAIDHGFNNQQKLVRGHVKTVKLQLTHQPAPAV